MESPKYNQQLICSDPTSVVEVNVTNTFSLGLPVILNMPAEEAMKTTSLSELIRQHRVECVKMLPDGSLKCNYQECTTSVSNMGRASDMARHLVKKHYEAFSQFAWLCPCCGRQLWFATSSLAKEHLRLPCPNLHKWMALKQQESPDADALLSNEFKAGWRF